MTAQSTARRGAVTRSPAARSAWGSVDSSSVTTRRILSDPQLRRAGIVILDEFHERHLDADLALMLLRRLQFNTRPDLGLRYLWQAVLAAYVSVGAPRVTDPPTNNVPTWDESLALARASLDEHKIKLVDVAHEQDAFYADPVYRRAAARRLKLIQSG